MSSQEIPVVISCSQDELLSILHIPVKAEKIGVLIVVGGPQYRVGSHRQFVLLARKLCENNFSVMRFDYRGMGDSSGIIRSFAQVDEDIQAAIDAFYEQCPDLTGVVIWGLCDAASAALFYAYQDKRVQGLILLNPWVFTEQGEAKTYLKHYYWQRLTSADLWKKVLCLQFNYQDSLRSLVAFASKIRASTDEVKQGPKAHYSDLVDATLALPVRMRECLKRFNHPVMIILSGRDLTAEEFREVVKADHEWHGLLAQSPVQRVDIQQADHTFSSQQWRAEVENVTLEWVKALTGPA